MKFKKFKNLKVEWVRTYSTMCLNDEEKMIAQEQATEFYNELTKNGIKAELKMNNFGDPTIGFSASIKEICKLSDKLEIDLTDIAIRSYKRSLDLLKETE